MFAMLSEEEVWYIIALFWSAFSSRRLTVPTNEITNSFLSYQFFQFPIFNYFVPFKGISVYIVI